MSDVDEQALMDLLNETGELLERYKKARPAGSWARNLECLTAFAVVHQLWQEPQTKVGALVMEIMPLFDAAFEMGREAERNGTA